MLILPNLKMEHRQDYPDPDPYSPSPVFRLAGSTVQCGTNPNSTSASLALVKVLRVEPKEETIDQRKSDFMNCCYTVALPLGPLQKQHKKKKKKGNLKINPFQKGQNWDWMQFCNGGGGVHGCHWMHGMLCSITLLSVTVCNGIKPRGSEAHSPLILHFLLSLSPPTWPSSFMKPLPYLINSATCLGLVVSEWALW